MKCEIFVLQQTSNRHHYETSMRCVYCVLCVEMFICHNLFVVPHVNLISKATGACIEKRQALCNTLQRIASKHKHKDMYFCNVGAYLLANAGTTAALSLEDAMPDGSIVIRGQNGESSNSESHDKIKCHIKITQQFPSEKSVSCHHL